ncbi:MAG: peptidoglycan-binding protein [Verrucomicrobiales bacterium]|nr:peptidoglycan-binding protein [Verrucomicrobiales bacterium]
MHCLPQRFLATLIALGGLASCGETESKDETSLPVVQIPPAVPPSEHLSTATGKEPGGVEPGPDRPPIMASQSPKPPAVEAPATVPSPPPKTAVAVPQVTPATAEGTFSSQELQTALKAPANETPQSAETPAADPVALKHPDVTQGLPKAEFASLNGLVLQVLKKMPQGGGYAASSDAATKLVSSTTLGTDSPVIQVAPEKAQPSFCSGATYLVFLGVVSELQTNYRLALPEEASKALLVKRQADGVGIWGRWNSNGPGTAKVFHDLGVGINFTDFAKAQPGDFMKIWWNDGIGSTERGHSVIYLGSSKEQDGTEVVKFWSSNLEVGFSEKTIPKSKIVRVLFSRLEDPSRLAEVTKLPAKDDYLADMLNRPSTEKEMFEVCGVESPVGSSLLRPGEKSGQSVGNGKDPGGEKKPLPDPKQPEGTGTVKLSPPTVPTTTAAPNVNEIFAGTPYAAFNFFSKTKILHQAQEVLQLSKDYPGVPDGSPGPMTDAAIKSWQKRSHLKETGLLDAATLKSMDLDGLPEETTPVTPAPGAAAIKDPVAKPKP